MPSYDYRCEKCHKSFSVVLSLKQHDAKKVACPKCGSRVVKQRISSFFAITSRKA
ncbi:MAG: zinc ribbon domain-containing protein [Candidatus Eisenbacteria bacterium]|nr:zinc ribbon domain-containing protein [Candidatus Eisenbacteria bacterium]